MLLRRISKHVKDQNWFAVFIDFLIVVLSILLAFWINDWAAKQSENQSLHAALESLHAEINTNIVETDKYSQLHIEIIEAGKELLRLARGSDLDTVPMSLVGKVFIAGYSTDYSTGALTSILDQTSFTRMPNNKLRSEISALPAEFVDTIEDEILVLQNLDNEWNPYISKKLPVGPLWDLAFESTWTSTFIPQKEAYQGHSVSVQEFSKLAASLTFQNHIENRIAYQKQVIREQKELRLTLLDISALIDKELNQ